MTQRRRERSTWLAAWLPLNANQLRRKPTVLQMSECWWRKAQCANSYFCLLDCWKYKRTKGEWCWGNSATESEIIASIKQNQRHRDVSAHTQYTQSMTILFIPSTMCLQGRPDSHLLLLCHLLPHRRPHSHTQEQTHIQATNEPPVFHMSLQVVKYIFWQLKWRPSVLGP